MDDLEKVETIRTKCNVVTPMPRRRWTLPTATFWNAIIWLESQGRPRPRRRMPPPSPRQSMSPRPRMVAAQAAYEKSSEKTDFSKKMDGVWEYLKKLFRLSLDTKFIATRRDAIILNIPILIPIVALFAWAPRYG